MAELDKDGSGSIEFAEVLNMIGFALKMMDFTLKLMNS